MNKSSKAAVAMKRYYNRIAPFYDFMEGLMERSSFRKWRGQCPGSRRRHGQEHSVLSARRGSHRDRFQ
ncbi:MAG: hypothetical protein PHR56_08450 [Dehalococcoidales bacterium]|nr:hypothetical protein [Dehalococcoidales bacterium]